jgi:sporulation protein YlmC with PRC-barrel domain
MKFRYELLYKEVYVENLKVGIITDIILDPEEWKITHFAIKLTSEAAKELLGAKGSFYNTLAIKAVGPASKSCTKKDRIDLQVSKGQMHMYLRPHNGQ